MKEREEKKFLFPVYNSGTLAVVSSQVELRSHKVTSCKSPFSPTKMTSDFKKRLESSFSQVKE